MNRHYPTERLVFGKRQAAPRRRLATEERLRFLREAAAKPEVDDTKFRELLQVEERQAALDARKDFDRAFSCVSACKFDPVRLGIGVQN